MRRIACDDSLRAGVLANIVLAGSVAKVFNVCLFVCMYARLLTSDCAWLAAQRVSAS